MAIDTLASIAEKAGCSVSTVSRVLSGKAAKYRISEATAERVMREIKKVNYTPSLLAKGLREGKTNTIGLILPGLDDTFFSSIASTIISEARKLNYNVVVGDTQENEKNEKAALYTLLARGVDGIIAIPCGNEKSAFQSVKEKGLPVVIVDRYFKDEADLSFVTTDNYKGSVMAVEHLIENGHRDIACIQGNPAATTSKDRAKGYVDTMAKHGLEENIICSGEEFSIQGGYLETNLLLARKKRPTAILVMSNKILLGSIKAIHEAGLKVPEDISLISFDDNLLFNYLDPKITCIAQPVNDLSMFAVKLLVKKIAGESETSNIFLPPSIVIRNSIKKI